MDKLQGLLEKAEALIPMQLCLSLSVLAKTSPLPDYLNFEDTDMGMFKDYYSRWINSVLSNPEKYDQIKFFNGICKLLQGSEGSKGGERSQKELKSISLATSTSSGSKLTQLLDEVSTLISSESKFFDKFIKHIKTK